MHPVLCRLCGEPAPLVSSHIFPEFFYASLYGEANAYLSVSNDPRHRPTQRRQRGLTERLLCAACDGKIGRYESYAASLLRRVDSIPLGPGGGVVVEGVDLFTFRLFGLSLLWRAHESTAPMFAAVQLGVRGERLRAKLQTGDPGAAHEFGFAIGKVTGLDMRGHLIKAPMSGESSQPMGGRRSSR